MVCVVGFVFFLCVVSLFARSDCTKSQPCSSWIFLQAKRYYRYYYDRATLANLTYSVSLDFKCIYTAHGMVSGIIQSLGCRQNCLNRVVISTCFEHLRDELKLQSVKSITGENAFKDISRG